MAYSTSRKTLEAMLPLLEPLKSGPCEWTTPPELVAKLAYKIREAFYIARLYRDEYPEIAQAADTYKLSVSRDGIIRAVHATVQTARVTQIAAPTRQAASLEHFGSQSVESILRAWRDAQMKGQRKLHFGEARLSPAELMELFDWCADNECLFFESAGAITLQVHDPDLADFAWSPDDLEEDDE